MADATITMPPSAPGLSRRGLMARAGLAGAAAALGTGLLDVGDGRRGNSADAANPLRATFGPTTVEKKFVVSDLDILTFALNTEYFEAEFYLRAVNGTGLPASLTTGGQGYGKSPYNTATPGVVNAYATGTSTVTTAATTPVPFTDSTIQQFAQELASDEQEHVTYLRTLLGKHVPARPACDLAAAFTQFMLAAGVITAPGIFDPFASQRNFLLAAYLINDIGPTAYIGASPYLSSTAYIKGLSGILGTEAYHAGETRTLIFATAQEQNDQALLVQAAAISTQRNTAAAFGGAATVTDQGVVDANGVANITPADADGIAFARPFPAILSLFYQSGTKTQTPAPAGFTPSGFNGRIR